MKKSIKLLVASLMAMVGFAACTTEPALEELEGKYPAPEQYNLTTLLAQERVKGDKVHNFNLLLATEGVTLNGENYGGSGAVLDIQFVGSKYYLESISYSAAAASEAKNGNYIVGAEGSAVYVIDNGAATRKEISKGSLIVEAGEGAYTIYGNLWLTDDSVAAIESTVVLAYEPFPEPTKLTQALSATSNLANGINTVTLQLATADIYSELDMTTWQTIWHGEGFYLSTDIYSPDGYLHEGTYKANAVGGVVGEGEFGIGYDTEMDFGWGPMLMENWGTCWWTVAGGVATAEKILEGEITVSKKGSKYTITYKGGGLWCEFNGAIDALNPDAGQGGGGEDTTDYEELSVLLSAQSNVAFGTPTLTFNMATEGVSSSLDTTTYQTVYSGTGNYLAMDIYSADGKLYTGTYNANAVGGTIAEGEFGIGYDTEMDFGWGPMLMENWGTCWWTVTDGATSAQKVLDGTVVVAVEGDNLVIKLQSTTANAKFTYPVADFKDGQGNTIEVVDLGGGSEPAIEYEQLTNVIAAQSNVAYGTNSVTLKIASNDSIYSEYNESYQEVWYGEGNYLAMDIYSADGTLAEGTYTANAVGGTIAEGEFGIGYDTEMWGMTMENWGTCWWTVTDGATSAEKVLDGTLTVAKDGDNYTITLESSVVNAQYVGTVTIP